ncbi:hypothetical protein ACHAXR_006928 [Thalassiosira sp. AJA248-18]
MSCECDTIVPPKPSAAESLAPLHVETTEFLDDESIVATNIGPIHFCFVVHGHNGKPTDLSYLHSTVKAKGKGMFADAKSSSSCVVGKKEQDDNAVEVVQNGESRRGKLDRLLFSRNKKQNENRLHDSKKGSTANNNVMGNENTKQSKNTLVVHNAACNEGKTHDGIIKGGERLATEMLNVIRSEQTGMQQQEDSAQREPIDVTISIVGNSLGGLYGRYAVAELAEVLESPTQTTSGEENEASHYYLLDGYIRVHLNVFCSTASPHLGCASHTYLPIPRTAEIAIGQGLGQSGSDLFQLNDLVENMATSPRFLKPLASFRRRIAYANAYGTDFPVPGSTAAFLDKTSVYPHYFEEYLVEGGNEKNAQEIGLCFDAAASAQRKRDCPASERGLIVATLYTPCLAVDANTQTQEKGDNLTAMSSSLDSLGWEKVFVDMRNEISMAVSLPTSWSKSECAIQRLKSSNHVVTSRDLARAVSTSGGYRLGLPLGHNAICAFTRGTVSTAVNSGGRPVMDSLATTLTDEILMWNGLN